MKKNIDVIPYGEQVTFTEFCENHNIRLEAHERSGFSELPPWYVSSKGLVEIRRNGTLTSTFGQGDSPEEAFLDYAKQLAGQRLLIGGYDGVEAVAPNEWLPECAICGLRIEPAPRYFTESGLPKHMLCEETGQRDPVPVHPHDGCSKCVYLGTIALVGREPCDLYRCDKGFVLRYGPEGNYESNTTFGGGLSVRGDGWRAILVTDEDSAKLIDLPYQWEEEASKAGDAMERVVLNGCARRLREAIPH